MDQYANEVGEVQLAAQQAGLQWGIWVNVSRNPRLKSVAWPEMRLSAEVPKSLTLAPVTIRVQRREWDEFFHCWRPVTAAAAADATGGDVNAEGSAEAAAAGHQQQHDIGAAGAAGAPVARVSASGGALAAGGGADASTTSSGAVVAGGGSVGSSNEFMAVGGVFTVDLLGIPPAAKKTKGWVMRNVTPLAAQVQRIPYPIPPAGADPATWRSEEEPPPFRFTLPLSPDLALFDNPLKVGWWDADACSWSQQGITDVAYNRGSGMLSFSSTHLAPMAVIQSRTRVLPYKGWTVRPLDGLHSRRAEVALHVGLKLPLTFEVGPGYVSLSGPEWPELGSVLKQSLTPWKLLHSLAKVGLHLMPEDRDAPAAGVTVKAPAVEDAMCANVAMLCGAYLLAGSKWNQSGSDQECICRVSQILDWEEGGRTEALHVERIFGKEKLDGPRKVLSIIQRGTRGVAFCDCFDQHESFHALPGTATLEEVKIAMDCVLGEVHANSLALLTGNFASPSERDGELARGLKAREDNLDVIRSTDPLLTQTLAQLLKGLRVFSFS